MKLITASLLMVGITVAPVLADEAKPWSKVGSWDVMIDTSISGCFIVASYTLGDVIRVGINNNNKNGYVVLGNSAWRSIELGKEYDLTFQFDGETPWTGTFRGKKFGDGTFLAVNFKDAKFLREFAARPGLTIYYGDKLVTRLPLTGSYAAMQSLIQCQDKLDASLAPTPSLPRDPFSGGGARPASDPFAE